MNHHLALSVSLSPHSISISPHDLTLFLHVSTCIPNGSLKVARVVMGQFTQNISIIIYSPSCHSKPFLCKLLFYVVITFKKNPIKQNVETLYSITLFVLNSNDFLIKKSHLSEVLTLYTKHKWLIDGYSASDIEFIRLRRPAFDFTIKPTIISLH